MSDQKTESSNNLIASSPNPDEPVIPKRPSKTKKSESSSAQPIASSSVAKSSAEQPIADSLSSSQADSKNDSDQSDQASTPPIPNRPAKDKNNNPNEPESVLNSQQEDANSDSELEGDITPGNSNTKITFKDEVDEDDYNANNTDSSSFNDDVETVLQDRDTEGGSYIESQPDVHDGVAPTADSSNNSNESTNIEPKVIDQPDKSVDHATPSIDEASKDVNIEVPDIEQSNKEDIEQSIENVTHEQTTDEQLALNDNDDISNKIETSKPSETKDLTEPDAPVIPTRPKKASTEESIETPQIPSSRPSKSKVNSQEPEPQNTTTPTIPSRPRPKAKSSELTPVESKSVDKSESPAVPARPEKSSEDSSSKASPQLSDVKPKAPPPKPKKLSSKIAAFQQMFNQEKKEELDSEKEDSNVSKPSPVTRGKLSSDKMKFAESLKGMMGKGIALPGMTNPNIPTKSEESLVEDSKKDEEIPTSTDSKIKPISNRPSRAKGPRGKRLPNSLKKPLNVEVEPRFKLIVEDLWDLKFEPKVDSVESTEDLVKSSEDETALQDTDSNREDLVSQDPVLTSNESISDSKESLTSIPGLNTNNESVPQEDNEEAKDSTIKSDAPTDLGIDEKAERTGDEESVNRDEDEPESLDDAKIDEVSENKEDLTTATASKETADPIQGEKGVDLLKSVVDEYLADESLTQTPGSEDDISFLAVASPRTNKSLKGL
ncbi:hypothetical protein QCA50_013019 [Cerrena zonata]|uniref:Altered inheritance of mitochondria protein 21 n=1 Tax=Cerrena zonata TaxID=2478898 RepID=A0AAW0FT94_9APHY